MRTGTGSGRGGRPNREKNASTKLTTQTQAQNSQNAKTEGQQSKIQVISEGCSYKEDLKMVPIFSSPEHDVLMVSYCDRSLSIVLAFGWTDFEIIIQEYSLGNPLPKLLKPFHST